MCYPYTVHWMCRFQMHCLSLVCSSSCVVLGFVKHISTTKPEDMAQPTQSMRFTLTQCIGCAGSRRFVSDDLTGALLVCSCSIMLDFVKHMSTTKPKDMAQSTQTHTVHWMCRFQMLCLSPVPYWCVAAALCWALRSMCQPPHQRIWHNHRHGRRHACCSKMPNKRSPADLCAFGTCVSGTMSSTSK